MTKTQSRKQKSEQWKKDNDWGLTQEQRAVKRAKRAQDAITEKISKGEDASILIDLFIEAFGYEPSTEFPEWMKYLSFEQRKATPGYFNDSKII